MYLMITSPNTYKLFLIGTLVFFIVIILFVLTSCYFWQLYCFAQSVSVQHRSIIPLVLTIYQMKRPSNRVVKVQIIHVLIYLRGGWNSTRVTPAVA